SRVTICRVAVRDRGAAELILFAAVILLAERLMLGRFGSF
ncbi:hypothetical protein Tco_1496913, partial [Tanacetum coccineum]